MKFDWDKAIDYIQFGMLWFVVAVLVLCVSVLILFDVLAGAGVMTYLTANNVPASVFISLATSGLLLALMVIGYAATNKKATLQLGWIVILIAFGVYCLDVYFDSLTADYLRFGSIMELKDLASPNIQILFRGLIGGISTVGEALAMSIIMGMPLLKEIINKAIPASLRQAPKPTSSNPIPEYAQKEQIRNQQNVPTNQTQRQAPRPQSNFPAQLKAQMRENTTYHPVTMREDRGDRE